MSSGAPYRSQLAAVVRALSIAGPTSYRWLGRSFRVGESETDGGRFARDLLAEDVAERLYREFYCAGRPTIQPVPVERALAARATHIDALSAANAGSGMWTTGWTVSSIEREGVRVHRAGLELLVPSGQLRVRAAGPPASGEDVAVRYPKEFLAVSPGYYIAVGDAAPAEAALKATVRVYLNVAADGAAPLVASLTSLLNQARVPFRLKVLDDPVNFTRCDAAVLFVPRADFHAAAPPLRLAVHALRPWLGGGVPALTKRLRPGVGVAEDPRHAGESFGSHRCRLVALALVDAHERGLRASEARTNAVVQRFASAGVSIELPYLERGSTDIYHL